MNLIGSSRCCLLLFRVIWYCFFFFPFFDSHLKTPLMKPASLFYTTKCFTLMIQWTRPKAKACRKFPLFSAPSYFFKEWFPSSCLKHHNSIILRLKLLHVFAFLHGTISFKVAPALGATRIDSQSFPCFKWFSFLSSQPTRHYKNNLHWKCSSQVMWSQLRNRPP